MLFRFIDIYNMSFSEASNAGHENFARSILRHLRPVRLHLKQLKQITV